MKNRKLKLLLAGACIIPPIAAHANPGCGLGAQVFEGQEGVFAHVQTLTLIKPADLLHD